VSEPDFVRDTRASYDAIAADYFVRFGTELEAKPLDRAMLAGFAELVRAAGGGPVADIGCGAGRVAAHLERLGLSVFGIDLSPEMIAQARRLYPGLRFEVGSMLALDLPDDSLGGVLAWYSTIHIPADRLPEVFAEFYRVLAPGGYLQLGFQVRDELRHISQSLGRAVSVDAQPRHPDAVARLLGAAGFDVRAQLVREPDKEGEFPERDRQAFLLARRPVSPAAT
jgi:SAM-dependent methyltransferase